MASLKEVSQYYPKLSVTYAVDKQIYGEPDPTTLDMLGRLKGKVLEVGAGDGRYTLPMLDQGLDVVASDISKEALDVLKKKTSQKHADQLGTVIFNAFEPFPFPDETFDGVVSTAFLYLFPEKYIRGFMEEAHRVTKKDGQVLIDFSTNIKRTDPNGQEIRGEQEVNYSWQQGVEALESSAGGLFTSPIIRRSIVDQNLFKTAGYRMQASKYSVLFEKVKYS